MTLTSSYHRGPIVFGPNVSLRSFRASAAQSARVDRAYDLAARRQASYTAEVTAAEALAEIRRAASFYPTGLDCSIALPPELSHRINDAVFAMAARWYASGDYGWAHALASLMAESTGQLPAPAAG